MRKFMAKNKVQMHVKTYSMCMQCEYCKKIGKVFRNGKLQMSTKCSKKGLTAVKERSCRSFFLKGCLPEPLYHPEFEKSYDALAWIKGV